MSSKDNINTNPELANILTLEYIQRHNLLDCSKDELPSRVDEIMNIHSIIENRVKYNGRTYSANQ